MLLPILGDLPFERGKTAADGLLTPTSTYREEICGRPYFVNDTVHESGSPVVLLTVRNGTGAAITVARKFGLFKTSAAKLLVNTIGTFPCDSAGALALPIDDAYTVGQSIPANDIFYVVLLGYCYVTTAASVTNLATGIAITTDNAGLIANKAQPAAGEKCLGRLDYAAAYAASTATRVFIDPGQLTPPGA